jgi:hypothetical protein
MKVEPRVTFVGMSLKSVKLASKDFSRSYYELVLSFEGEGPERGPRQYARTTQEQDRSNRARAHLICQPEGNLVTPPDGGQPFVHITGMKYEIGTGDLAILVDVQELAGEAAGVLGKIVTQTSHDARQGVFGLQLGAEYGIIITPAGMRVLYTKELACEFRKPLVSQ